MNLKREQSHIDITPGGGLRYMLGINSANTNPELVRTDAVLPVIDMSMNGHL